MSASWEAPTLTGKHVRLVPLEAAHADALGTAAADGELWALPFTSVPAPGAERAYIDAALAARDAGESMPFAVLDATGSVIGSTRFYEIDRSVPTLHIGYTWYAKRAQRTAVNSEAKWLLLDHAFRVLHCESVCFETSHLNTRSQAAIERLGARRDGILRAHMRHRDGSLRDTWRYSIVRAEWPAVERALLERLAAGAIA
ncbi:GNAT family N-acetyltransferase [Cognatilysobacter lacus]|uniref:GNAT family N-acetyltransferase n=1 Tax=Cognatilysobacter lacus TaxID=1643323 RepID=A0A5D8ZAN8_9GAMM|nr:GNAT family N-acetyltransferase [Lysobacter lacus]TZF91123.1 GNAT family N-acetyltransferase [Lysobacter lacus]